MSLDTLKPFTHRESKPTPPAVSARIRKIETAIINMLDTDRNLLPDVEAFDYYKSSYPAGVVAVEQVAMPQVVVGDIKAEEATDKAVFNGMIARGFSTEERDKLQQLSDNAHDLARGSAEELVG